MQITKRKIALGLCLFLTLAPIIGSCIWADNPLGTYVGNLTPYLHLTMPQFGGLPFAEAIGGLLGLSVFVVGLISFIVFIATKFKKVGGLLFLLYMTILYSGLRALGGLITHIFSFGNYETKTKIFIVIAILSDIAWGILCYWATTILTQPKFEMDRHEEKHAA